MVIMVVGILDVRGRQDGTRRPRDQLWVEVKVDCRHFERSRRMQSVKLQSLEGRRFQVAGLMNSRVERKKVWHLGRIYFSP